MHDSLQALAAVLWPYIQEWLKASNLPLLRWINEKTPAANRALAWLVALASGIGFHFAWQAVAAGGGHLVIDVPAGGVVVRAVAHAMVQHFVYTVGIKQTKLLESVAAAARVTQTQPVAN